jgi:hypothetical protein
MTDRDVSTNDRSPCTTMTGGGAYDAGARHQRTAIELAMPLLVRALDACPVPSGGSPFVLVDYGSATGYNSFAPVREVVSAVRRRSGTLTPVCVVHNDQADNDFAALFRQVSSSSESYLHASLVFPFAVGQSFFGPVVPTGFASLGWSSNAVHWLSAAPHGANGRLWFRRPPDGVDTAFARRALADWRTFLAERARELQPAGELVVTMVDADESGASGADHFLDMLGEIVEGRLASGALRRAEVARMSVPLYYRTEREIRSAFDSPDVGERLALVEYEHATLHDPLWAAFERTGDVAAFARAHVAWQRAFSEHALFSVLDDDRSPDDRREIADRVYDELCTLVQARPGAARCSWRLALLRIVRR